MNVGIYALEESTVHGRITTPTHYPPIMNHHFLQLLLSPNQHALFREIVS
jgi:hypothetical protein